MVSQISYFYKGICALTFTVLPLVIISCPTWHKFKNLVKEKTTQAGFKYLLEEKAKQSKILNLHYSKLEMQEYLWEENRNKEVAKLIYKARGKRLDIKTHKSWG